MEETVTVDAQAPLIQQVAPPPDSESQIVYHQPFKKKPFIIGAIVLLLVLGFVYLLFFTAKKVTPLKTVMRPPVTAAVTASISALPSPSIAPLSTATVDQTLNDTDTSMGQALNQVDTDLKQISSVDKSQDSTIGL